MLLIQTVQESCDNSGVICQPGCQEAIDSVKNCGHPSVATKDTLEYLLYTMVYLDIHKYEGFVSSMHSCSPRPVITIDIEITPNVTHVNSSTRGVCELSGAQSAGYNELVIYVLCIVYLIRHMIPI